MYTVVFDLSGIPNQSVNFDSFEVTITDAGGYSGTTQLCSKVGTSQTFVSIIMSDSSFGLNGFRQSQILYYDSLNPQMGILIQASLTAPDLCSSLYSMSQQFLASNMTVPAILMIRQQTYQPAGIIYYTFTLELIQPVPPPPPVPPPAPPDPVPPVPVPPAPPVPVPPAPPVPVPPAPPVPVPPVPVEEEKDGLDLEERQAQIIENTSESLRILLEYNKDVYSEEKYSISTSNQKQSKSTPLGFKSQGITELLKLTNKNISANEETHSTSKLHNSITNTDTINKAEMFKRLYNDGKLNFLDHVNDQSILANEDNYTVSKFDQLDYFGNKSTYSIAKPTEWTNYVPKFKFEHHIPMDILDDKKGKTLFDLEIDPLFGLDTFITDNQVEKSGEKQITTMLTDYIIWSLKGHQNTDVMTTNPLVYETAQRFIDNAKNSTDMPSDQKEFITSEVQIQVIEELVSTTNLLELANRYPGIIAFVISLVYGILVTLKGREPHIAGNRNRQQEIQNLVHVVIAQAMYKLRKAFEITVNEPDINHSIQKDDRITRYLYVQSILALYTGDDSKLSQELKSMLQKVSDVQINSFGVLGQTERASLLYYNGKQIKTTISQLARIYSKLIGKDIDFNQTNILPYPENELQMVIAQNIQSQNDFYEETDRIKMMNGLLYPHIDEILKRYSSSKINVTSIEEAVRLKQLKIREVNDGFEDFFISLGQSGGKFIESSKNLLSLIGSIAVEYSSSFASSVVESVK